MVQDIHQLNRHQTDVQGNEESIMKERLLMVITGPGKGKTTSAVGMAVRAAGNGLKVCFIQFIKGSRKTGEIEATEPLAGLIDFHVMGRGFTWKSANLEDDKAAALEAWAFAREAMTSGHYFMVVLDEFTYPLTYKMIDLKECLEALANDVAAGTNIVITGRDAPQPLMELADTVSEVHAVKHHFAKGVKARKGIEF